MGYFSSKRRTYVSTSVSRMIEDNLVPTPVLTGTIRSVFNESNLSDSILDEVINSVGFKTNALFRYAQSPKYVRGLPTHNFINSAIGTDVVKNVIEGLVGQSVEMEYSILNGYNPIHRGFQDITENYGYNHLTNQLDTLTTTEGYPCYLETIIAAIDTRVIPSDDPNETTEFIDPSDIDIAPWEIAPNERYVPWENPSKGKTNWVFEEAANRVIIVYAFYDEANDEVVRDEIEIDLDAENTDMDLDYYHAKYFTRDADGHKVPGYFTYQDKESTYPVLDTVTDLTGSSDQTRFMPMVLFRSKDKNLTDPQYHDTDAFKSTKGLLRKVNIDYESLNDSIHENPDIDKIEQAAMVYGIPISSDNELDIRYLYSFFNWIFENDPSQLPSLRLSVDPYFVARQGTRYKKIKQTALHYEEGDLNFTLKYDGVASRIHTGSIGEVGTVTKATRTEQMEYNYQEEVSYGGGRYGARRVEIVEKTKLLETTVITLTKQTAPNVYRVIEIAGLEQSSEVVKGHHATIAIDEDENLLIPINYDLVINTFNFLERNQVFARSMHLVFNSKVTVKVKWYQTALFRFVLIAIAIVITILSVGTGSGFSGAILGFAAGTTAAILVNILVYIAISVVTQYAFEFVAKQIGGELALILAIILIAVGAGAKFKGNNTWSTELMKAGTNLQTAANNQFMKELNEYSIETQEFINLGQKELDEIEEINKSLDTITPIDPLEIVGLQPIAVLGETPSNFYNRTVHAGNIGTLGFNYIHSYVDLSLRLPTFNETIGGFENGNI